MARNLRDRGGPAPAVAVHADPARLGTEYRLGEFERRQVDRSRAPSFRLGVIVLIVASVSSPTAIIPFLDSQPGDLQFGVIWAPVIGCLLAIGAWLVWRSPPRRVIETLWYTEGLLQPAAEPEPLVIRWPEIVSLYVGIHRSDEYPTSITFGTVCDRNGTCLTVFGPEVVRKAAGLLAPALLPALVRDLDAGVPVHFGGLLIDQSGISDERDTAAPAPVHICWPDMRRITVDARVTLKIWPAGRWTDTVIDLEDVPNGFLAHYLVEHAAASAGVPVVYVGEKRFPPRLPALSAS